MAFPTPQQWTEDYVFVLNLRFDPDLEESQRARLKDRLAVRYPEPVAHQVFESLLHSRNWVVVNWDYLKDVGLIQGGGVVNCLILAVQEAVFSTPLMEWHLLPAVNPRTLVKLAQRYIDAERQQSPEG